MKPSIHESMHTKGSVNASILFEFNECAFEGPGVVFYQPYSLAVYFNGIFATEIRRANKPEYRDRTVAIVSDFMDEFFALCGNNALYPIIGIGNAGITQYFNADSKAALDRVKGIIYNASRP